MEQVVAGCPPASAACLGLFVPCSQLSTAVKANRWLLVAESLSRLGLAALSLLRSPHHQCYTPNAVISMPCGFFSPSCPRPLPLRLTHNLTELIEGDVLEGWYSTGLQDEVGLLQGWLSHTKEAEIH